MIIPKELYLIICKLATNDSNYPNKLMIKTYHRHEVTTTFLLFNI